MIPQPWCSHGDGQLAVAAVWCEQGCVARPDDRQQWLCAQHWYSAPDGLLEPWGLLWEDPGWATVMGGVGAGEPIQPQPLR